MRHVDPTNFALKVAAVYLVIVVVGFIAFALHGLQLPQPHHRTHY